MAVRYALALLAALTLSSGTALAQEYIFWADENANAIGRANLDGSAPNPTFISLTPSATPARGFAYGGAFIYWGANNNIGRANTDGTGVDETFIAGINEAPSIIVDGTYIYWIDNSYIARANLDGTGVDQTFLLVGSMRDLTADANYLYWINTDNSVGRANLDGTGMVNPFFATGSIQAFALAVDANYVYWTNAFFIGGTIGRANIDGTSPDPNFIPNTGQSQVYGISVDATSIYWSDNNTPGSISRADLDGTNVSNLIAPTATIKPYRMSTSTATVLPVELTAFTATLDGTTARLAWETASETNNAGFAIEHRVPEATDFTEAGFVAGAGTTEAPRTYTFALGNLTPGAHAFRLRQTDFDGATTLSEAVEVTVALEGTHALAVWPNPSAAGTVRLSVAEAQAVTVGLYDALGRRVAVLHDGGVSGTLEVALPARLPSGVYLVRAEGEAFAETVRVTVAR